MAIRIPRRVAAGLVVAMLVAATRAEAQGSTRARVAPGPTGDLPPARQKAADSLAEATIQATCESCHPQFVVVQSRRSPADWDAVLTRMVGLGAQASAEQVGLIRRYLVRYHGTIPVNSAKSQDFSAVLGYSPKASAAIVAYRRKHGPFASVDALAKVPGIDRRKLDQQTEALQFDNPGRGKTR